MIEMYIPPYEISFRLQGYSTKYVLFSRNSPDPTFGQYGGSTYDDQWWQLVPGTGNHDGYHLIKSKYTGNVIFSRKSPSPRVGHIGGGGQHEDNWFKFEPGTGKLAGYFRIRNYATDAVLYSRTKIDPTLYDYPGNKKVYDDQYFTFLFENMKIDRVDYQIDEAKILTSIPEIIGTETLRNDTSVNQTVEFNFSRTEISSSSFEYTRGFTVTVGTSGKVGFPFVTEGEVKVDVSNSHTLKWGTTTTESKTFTTRLLATVPPYNKVIATASVTCAKIQVPFTLYSKSAATGFEVATHGTYNGATYWNLQSDIREEPL